EGSQTTSEFSTRSFSRPSAISTFFTTLLGVHGPTQVQFRINAGGTVDNRDRQAQYDLIRHSRQLACLLLSVLVAGVLAPVRSGSSADSDVDRRVDAIIAKMTLEEKIDYLGGTEGFYVRALPELGVPRLRMADGPMGVRNFGPATAMPAGINLAATWDPALAERVGTQIGLDA